jgi:tRNA (mo5U34)-methyltransferase
MEIGHLTEDLSPYVERLRAARASVTEPVEWYRYDTLANLIHVDAMLAGEHRELDALAAGRPVADIGAADGDLAFTLEAALGWEMDIIDNAPTNQNGLEGARLLKEALGSSAQIHHVDLDTQFQLPRQEYGLVFLLGILYHLKNPFYVLEALARQARHCFVSTRVARLAGAERRPVGDLPMAYLVGPAELNDDATNFWIFTPPGLERVVERAGWEILSTLNAGETTSSVPDSLEGDERMFMLLRSRHDRLGGPSAAGAKAVAAPADDGVQHCWPLGHHYSPVPDTRALAIEPTRSRVWPAHPHATPGIDWRGEEQVALVRDALARQEPMPFASEPTGDSAEYHTGNGMFSLLDAWVLQAMLRHHRPARMIEVGCGWSSLVTARVNREQLGGALDFTCVEPYPPDFLGDGVDGITRLVPAPVQEVELAEFERLGDGDVLFIDSAHVVKTGGDVQYLFNEVIPRLATGVLVHVHDIFLPWDYPADWVLSGRGWNEQYLLQSFLAFNETFAVRLAVGWLHHFHRDVLVEAVPGYAQAMSGGGSFWMQRSRA